MKIMKKSRAFKSSFVALAVLLAVSIASSAAADGLSTAPGQNKLLCFDGTTDGGFGGICTLKANGAKGPATLNNTDSNPAGDYAGVYILDSTLFGQLLTGVTQLGYHYSGITVPTPGDLSLNLPVSITGGTATSAYAYIDAFYCPGVGGVVDVINDSNCGIWYGSPSPPIGVFYANWAAFVAAYPGARVATDNFMFVIAERTPAEGPAFWTVSNVKLGKGGK
jgi:hypothetical protein